jgi:hypothetical protein
MPSRQATLLRQVSGRGGGRKAAGRKNFPRRSGANDNHFGGTGPEREREGAIDHVADQSHASIFAALREGNFYINIKGTGKREMLRLPDESISNA